MHQSRNKVYITSTVYSAIRLMACLMFRRRHLFEIECREEILELQRRAADRGLLITDFTTLFCRLQFLPRDFERLKYLSTDSQVIFMTERLFEGPSADFRLKWRVQRLNEEGAPYAAMADFEAKILGREWQKTILDNKAPDTPGRLWHIPSKTSMEYSNIQSSFRPSYTAISYTWGRWTRVSKNGPRLPSVNLPGVPWQIPANTQFSISDLLHFLETTVETEYAWVDVLCINQENEKEKAQEINKQAGIFSGASMVFAWLWSIPDATPLKNLASALSGYCWFANTSLQRPHSFSREGVPVDTWEILRDDYLFSSTWTLQEALLAPGTILTARDGTIARHENGTRLSIGLITMLLRVHTILTLSARRCASDEARKELANTFDIPLRIWSVDRSAEIDGHEELLAGVHKPRNLDVESIQEWWSLDVGISVLENQSRSDALRAASARYYKAGKCKAPAIMAAIGCYEWQNESETPWIRQFPVSFLEEVKRKEGPIFFAGTGQVGQTFQGSMLPINDTRGPYKIPSPMKRKLTDVSDWRINSDGSVTIPKKTKFFTRLLTYGHGIDIQFIPSPADSVAEHVKADTSRKYIEDDDDWQEFLRLSLPASNIRFIPLQKLKFWKNIRRMEYPIGSKPISNETGIIIGQGLIAPDVWSKFGTFQRNSDGAQSDEKRAPYAITVS